MRRIRRYLDVKGVTVKGCADLLGVTEKTMYNKLSEATDFTYGEVCKLKTIFPEYDMDYLLGTDIA